MVIINTNSARFGGMTIGAIAATAFIAPIFFQRAGGPIESGNVDIVCSPNGVLKSKQLIQNGQLVDVIYEGDYIGQLRAYFLTASLPMFLLASTAFFAASVGVSGLVGHVVSHNFPKSMAGSFLERLGRIGG